MLLDLENMLIGIDPMDEVTLGTVWFVQGGSVQLGSYAYDDPHDASDPRVLSLGALPPIVYSETLNDLQLIKGNAGASDAGDDDEDDD